MIDKKEKNQEEKEVVSQEERRSRREARKRIFVTPQNGDEAEAALPSMERLANGYMIQLDNNGKIMSKEEILKRGTLLQKLRLYISSIDLSGYFEAEEQLTKEEERAIVSSIRTEKDRELSKLCVKEYRTIFDFGTRLSFFFKRFQTSYAILAVLLNKWDSYEYTAKQLTLLYSLMKSSFVEISEDGEVVQELGGEIYPDETRASFIEDILHSNVLDGAKLKFDDKTDTFFIDADETGGLYAEILEEAKSVTKDLSDFKAYAVVAEDYIKKSTLKFMPIPIQLSIENAEEERYTRYLVKNKRYFRSELNQRKANGETISKEDKKRAVIPDFYEVKPSKNVLEDCKIAIKK